MPLRKLGTSAVSLLIFAGVLSPWVTILLSPTYAFAQTVTATANSPVGNQITRQGGSLSLSQAAAGGAVSVGTCIAAAGITFGAGITWILSIFGVVPSTAATTPVVVAASAAQAVLSVPTSNKVLEVIAGEISKNTAATAATVSGSLTKSSIFDCIAWALAKAIWRAVAASVIDWINSGFNGRPSFIQNLGRFMEGIADQVAGDIIQNSTFAFLCSPFSASIRLALAVSFAKRTAPSCTLTQVMQNIRNFVGNFSQGGWPSWFQLLGENNNPYGSYIVGKATIEINITTAQGRKLNIANWSGGFLSKTEQVCTGDPSNPGAGGNSASCKEIIVTPGELIAQKASQVIGEGNVQLLLADELNQIISALVSQLMQKALQSFSGLSGSGGYQDDYYRSFSYTGDLSSPTGGGGYTGTLNAEGSAVTTGNAITTGNGITTGNSITTDGGITTGGGISTGGFSDGVTATNNSVAAQIAQALQNGQTFVQLNQNAVASIHAAQTIQSQVAACWNSKVTNVTLSADNLVAAQTNAASASSTIGTLAAQLPPFQQNIQTATANIATLQQFLTEANAATTQTDQANILYEYYALQANPAFAISQDTGTMTTTLSSLQTTLAVQSSIAQTSLQTCAAFPPQTTTTTP
jgi:hypothetical protein